MTTFLIKIIALISMVLDHVGVIFPEFFLSDFFRLIGVIAFPIFAYMIAQGCKQTKNINKYLLRLGIFALVSEIPFDLAFYRYFGNQFTVNFFRDTNVFFTLFLGAACIAVYEKLKEKLPLWITIKNAIIVNILAFIPLLPILYIANYIKTDFGMLGVAYILIFYFAKPASKIARSIAMAAVVTYHYAYPYIYSKTGGFLSITPPPIRGLFYTNNLYKFYFALIAVVLIYLYNGKQGLKVKWAFYAFYPIHIALLAAIKCFVFT